MNNKSIYKKAVLLSLPMMIQNGITNAVGLVDNLMVGSIGTEAVTSVSIITQLMFVFNIMIFGGLAGPGIFGAQYFGQGNTEGVRNSFRMKILIGIVCLFFGIGIFSAFANPLIKMYLNGESVLVDASATFDFAKSYLKIMMLGMPFFVITQCYSSILRECGNSFIPMAAGLSSVIVDIVFNWILIFGHLGFPKLGVSGAALATVLSRIVEAMVVIIWATIKRNSFTFLKNAYKTLVISSNIAASMVKKTIPILVNEFFWSGSLAILTQIYSIRGLEIITALNISNALNNILNMVFVSLGTSVGILTGQTLGCSEFKKAKSEAFKLTGFCLAICFALTLIMILLSGVFPKCYDTSAEIQKLATGFMIITALFFPIQGGINCAYFTIRAGGKTILTFLFDSVFSMVVSVPVAWVFCHLTSINILVVYSCVCAVDIIKMTIAFCMIKSDIWISNIVNDI